MNWTIQRHCFHCLTVERFDYCDNCGKYFCTKHHEWDWYMEGNVQPFQYPFHRDCL